MISDPQAIKFINEYARPMAELAREFRVRAQDLAQKWTEVSSLIPNSASEAVQDNRENEGISRLNGQEVTQLVSSISAMNAAMTNFATINKHCVRAIRLG